MTKTPKRYLRSFLGDESEEPIDLAKMRRMTASFRREEEEYPLLERVRDAARLVSGIAQKVTPELVNLLWKEVAKEASARLDRFKSGETLESITAVSIHEAVCDTLQQKAQTATDAETKAHFESMRAMTQNCPEIVDIVVIKLDAAIQQRREENKRRQKKPMAAEPK